MEGQLRSPACTDDNAARRAKRAAVQLEQEHLACVVKALERIVAVLAAVGLRAAPKVFDRVELGMELGE